MSRAIHKMRSSLSDIAVSIEDFGNINSTPGVTATFASVNVGTGGNRTLIIGITAEDQSGSLTQITLCSVDGNSMSKQVFGRRTVSGLTICTGIFTKDLSSESGNVDIIVTCSESVDSFAMSFLVVSGMQSVSDTDKAAGGVANDTTLNSVSTIDGEQGGITVAAFVAELRTVTQTWGSSLTKRSDVTTGSDAGDHRHGFAFDLLPSGRSASTETVTVSSSSQLHLSIASFR